MKYVALQMPLNLIGGHEEWEFWSNRSAELQLLHPCFKEWYDMFSVVCGQTLLTIQPPHFELTRIPDMSSRADLHIIHLGDPCLNHISVQLKLHSKYNAL